MKIRKAMPSDLRSVYDFVGELEEKKFDFDVFQELYLKNIAQPDYYYLMAEDQGMAVGFASLHTQILLHHGGKTGEIQELIVSKDYRGKGMGKMIMAEIERIGEAIGLLEIEVTSHRKRTKTHRFYQNMAYVHSHRKFTKALHHQTQLTP